MSDRSHNCRYCGEPFISQLGKPGYVDECPECLHERTRPKVPLDFAARFLARFPERKKSFGELRKQLSGLGIDETKVFEAIADGLKKSGTQI
jgi:hypothetical protein